MACRNSRISQGTLPLMKSMNRAVRSLLGTLPVGGLALIVSSLLALVVALLLLAVLIGA